MAINKEFVEHHGIRSRLRSIFSRQALGEEPSASEEQSASGFQHEEALRRMLLLVLQAVESNAIPGDDIDYEQFREDIRSMSKKFARDLGPDDILILAGQFSATLKDYFERTSRFLSTHNAEYQKMVSMFTETVTSLSASGERSVVNLKTIEQQIEHATVIEDIRTLRLRLGQCLGTIREEIHRQEALSAELLDRAAQSTENSTTTTEGSLEPSSQFKRDPVTGFPTQKEAEAALLKAVQSDHASFVVPIVAKGADKIYAQLGNEVGDGFLHNFSEQLRFLSNNGDRIFRWHGPAFVAILKRSTTIREVKRELSRLSAVRFDDPIEVGDRMTWLPVSTSWNVFSVTPPFSSLILQINEFVAS
jgi:GGDEF domain-containing protein